MVSGWVLLLAWLMTAASAGWPNLDEPLRTGATAPSDAAVVIGLESYAFIADVPYAHRDAQAVYDFLVYTQGVPSSQVQHLRSGGREQIEGAVKRALDQVGEGGTLWVYFAGHGAASATDGSRLLLGDDVRQDPAAFDARAVSVDDLKALAGDTRLTLLVDACYNGMGRTGEALVEGKRFAVPVYAKQPSTGILEWTAASPDQMSGPLDVVQHGAFTYFMLGAMRGWADGQIDGQRDGQVTAEEARLYVERALRTVQVHDQTPELVADAPGAWVLSTGELEPAPELGSLLDTHRPTAPVRLRTDVPLDGRNEALMSLVVQDIIDRCAAQHRGGPEAAEEWRIRFKIKKARARGIHINDAAMMNRVMKDGEEYVVDLYSHARSRCMRRAVKALRFNEGHDLVVTRTYRISEPGDE